MILDGYESIYELKVENRMQYLIDGEFLAEFVYVTCGCGCGDDTGDFIFECDELLDDEIYFERKENECEFCPDVLCDNREEVKSVIEIAEELVSEFAEYSYELIGITSRVCYE